MADKTEATKYGAKPFKLGNWYVEPSKLCISQGRVQKRLGPRVMALLVSLSRKPDVTRERGELEDEVWPGVTVGYDALAGAISKLRAALEDDPSHPTYVETVPKIGYRMIALVAPAEVDTQRIAPGRQRKLWLWVGALVALMGFGGWLGYSSVLAPFIWGDEQINGKPSIAVLPFENYTGDQKQTLWSDALADEIIADLSQFSDFFVIARNSSFSYRDKAQDIREVGLALGARYVVEGGLRHSGLEFEMTARLVETETGRHVWAKTFSALPDGLYRLPAEVTQEIVSTLGGRVDSNELERISYSDIANPEAYELVQLGRAEWLKWTAEANAKAEQMYSQAIEFDPGYASAYRSLAWVHINEHRYSWNKPRESALAAAHVAVARAIALAPFDYRVLWTRATVRMRSGDLEAALSDFQRSLELNPNAADVMADMSVALVYAGETSEAIKRLQEATQRNPLHPYWYDWNLAWAYYFANDPAAGLTAFERLTYIPDRALLTRAVIYQRLGRTAEARSDVRRYMAKSPAHTLSDEAEALSPMRDSALHSMWLDDLRAAGMPD